jgi:hypothetical protein
MIRAIIGDRRRRVWAILIGMSTLAISVEAVTMMIHNHLSLTHATDSSREVAGAITR